MGTWGLGTFEDDIACDWLEDLYDSDPLRFFVQCLDLSDRTFLQDQHQSGLGDLEFLACIGVVCTAEMIHALLREPRERLPEAARLWVDQHQDLDVFPLLPDAIAGLRRVLDSGSEMHQRWEDNEESYDAWVIHTGDLLSRLEVALVENA